MIDLEDTSLTPFAWECISQPDGCIDVWTCSNIKRGVRLVQLSEKLERHAQTNGQLDAQGRGYVIDIAVRYLWVHDNHQKNALALWSQLQEREHQKAYEQSTLAMARAQYEALLGAQPQDTSEYNCSQLVTETLQAMHLLGKPINSKQWTPKMLAQELNGRLPFREGVAGLEPILHVYRIWVPCVRESKAA